MADIFKDSFFVGMFFFLYKKFSLYKDTSIFNDFLKKIKKYYRYSGTKRILRNYVHKKDYYKYSITYRMIDFISRILSYLCLIIHRFLAKLLKGSVFFGKINSLNETPIKLLFMYIAFFTAAMELIYLILCIAFYGVERINMPVCAGLAFFVLLCLCLGNFWQYIKNSLIYRIICYFFEE